MAQSTFDTRQYTSEHFVESAGAVLFDLTTPQREVCMIHNLLINEYYLSKGRRNQRESRLEAAVRETQEETGFRCHLYPVAMQTRAQPAGFADVPDKAHVFPNLTEPFMFTMRAFDNFNVKLIFWYVAEVDEGARDQPLLEEVGFKAEFFPCDEALEKLTFQPDRDVLKKAMELVERQQKLGKGNLLPN